MEFHDDYPQYELMAHHSEEDGVKKRRKLWNVFWIMLTITLIELFVGFKAASWGIAGTTALKLFFIIFTIAKAYYIVFSFMHLGDENKPSKWAILAPYIMFILYLVYMTSVDEGTYSMKHRHPMNKHIIDQAAALRAGGHHGDGASDASHGNTENASHGEEAAH